ncbi:reverse transcriptase domain-containing protein [Tanacetum coccineum]
MPSHMGSYDGKGDPDKYLHLFEGAIRMQKWAMPVACHMFTYTLKDSARIWWNCQKESSIINYKDLKAKFWSHFSQQNRFTKTHLAVYNIKQKERESTRAFITRLRQEKSQPTELRIIIEKALVDSRKILLGTTIKGKRTETGSPHTGGLTMGCSPTYPRV